MKINKFAEHILFSEKLSDKLFFPDKITDNSYQKLKNIPKNPIRDAPISIRDKKKKEQFPKIHELENDRLARGKVLHFFANHELLALELMALMILRFPDSPYEFRKSLAYTIKDEQKHMKLYLNAMEIYGIGFGEISLNDMFWKSLSKTENLMQFICGMSLTFEQANLDFSYQYQKIFHKIGDLETANHLQEVYEDEISHVKNGLNWFQQWKDPKKSDWENYQSNLISPLSPIKGKGPEFVKEARIKAGLSESFIKKVYIYQNSNGKAPDVYLFNLTAEIDSINKHKIQTSKKHIKELEEDLSILPWVIAGEDDLLILDQKISDDYLLYLKKYGFNYPRIITKNDFKVYNLKLRELKPWAWSPKIIQFFSKKISLASKVAQNNFEDINRIELNKIHSKITALSDLNLLYKQFPQYCYNPKNSILIKSLDNIDNVLDQFPKDILIKLPYGASANKNKRFDLSTNKDRDNVMMYLKNGFKKHEEIIIEPWLNRVVDFAFQFERKKGELKFIGLSRFLADENGKYKANVINNFIYGLEKDLLKFLYQKLFNKSLVLSFMEKVKLILENNDIFSNYHGIIGVDAFVYKDENNDFKIRPIVEYNSRMNMGYLALKFRRLIDKNSYAFFEIINKKEFNDYDYRSLLVENSKIIKGDLICNDIKTINNYICRLRVYN